jgi:hypothetical protein
MAQALLTEIMFPFESKPNSAKLEPILVFPTIKSCS